MTNVASEDRPCVTGAVCFPTLSRHYLDLKSYGNTASTRGRSVLQKTL